MQGAAHWRSVNRRVSPVTLERSPRVQRGLSSREQFFALTCQNVASM